MASPSVTYTFSNGTTADATAVNTNFTDLINSMTDGTKSFSIDALTCAGTATFNGAVTLGNGSVDDITVTGSLASSIPIKTNNSYDIGAATLALAGVYLGAPSSRSTRLTANQSLSASHTIVLPGGNGAAGSNWRTDGSGNVVNQPPDALAAKNYSLTATAAANALTIALKDLAGSDASSTSPIDLVFRSSTAATGSNAVVSLTAAMSIVLPTGASLGHRDGHADYIYVYLINGTSNELAVCGSKFFQDGSVASATAISAASTSRTTLYATSSHTNKSLRYLGRVTSSQSTAGTYATSPSEVASQPNHPPIVSDHVNWTPTGSWSSNVTYTGRWWRIGPRGYFEASIALSGAPTSADLTITLPNSWQIDLTDMLPTSSPSARKTILGTVIMDDATGDPAYGFVHYNSATTVAIKKLNAAGSNGIQDSVNATSPFTWASGDTLTCRFDIPISGWGSTA